MQITDVINAVNETYPNTLTTKRKVDWLRRLDKQIVEEVLTRHDMPEDFVFPNFDEYNESTELLVPDIYGEVYENYLRMKISEVLLESERFASAQVAYNNNYISYQAWINRTYMPKQYETPLYRS